MSLTGALQALTDALQALTHALQPLTDAFQTLTGAPGLGRTLQPKPGAHDVHMNALQKPHGMHPGNALLV